MSGFGSLSVAGSKGLSRLTQKVHDYRFILAALIILAGLVIMLVNMLMGLTPRMAQLMTDHKDAKLDLTALNRPVGDLSNVVAPYVPPIDDSLPAPEFKPRSWVLSHGSDWTLQVMNVDSERLVKEYLRKRKDRQSFFYFKIRQDDETRYVLVYRLFVSQYEANRALSQVRFDLPDNVQAFVEHMQNYAVVLPDDAPKVQPLPARPAAVHPSAPSPVEDVPQEMPAAPMATEKGEAVGAPETGGDIPPGHTAAPARPGIASGQDAPIIPRESIARESRDAAARERAAERARPESKPVEVKPETSELPAVSDPF